MKKQIKRPLSSCCLAEVEVSCGDDSDIGNKEGVTCCYVCKNCGNSCNIDISHFKDGDQSPIEGVGIGKI